MIIVDQNQVDELLPMRECIGVMEKVLLGLTRGECLLPLLKIMWLREKTGALVMMPAYWEPAQCKAVFTARFQPSKSASRVVSCSNEW